MKSSMKISIKKLKSILLYFGTYTDTKFLGKVKLMKLFYFLDFIHVKKYGAPVTGDNYVNLEHGPIPSSLLNLVNNSIDDIDSSVLSDTISFERPNGINMCRMIPSRQFKEEDKKYFTDTELLVLEEVVQRFGNKNTKYIEDASHKESPWKNTRFLENIPYSLATEDNDSVASKEEIELLQKIK